jgi:hypothetical protein
MPTQKVFKHRVRARMSKTGESYAAARHQLLLKAKDPAGPPAPESTPATPELTSNDPTAELAAKPPSDVELLTSNEAMRRASGKGHDEWFALLDGWGATGHTHTEIASWLRETQGVGGWWAQNITVNYERARGLRDRHQMLRGYSVSVTKTVAVEPGVALEAFTSPTRRKRWLPDAQMRQRATRAELAARFDWPEPASRVVVTVGPKGDGKAVVAVTHEHLPDAASAERLKAAWRGWLVDLKAYVERDRRRATESPPRARL